MDMAAVDEPHTLGEIARSMKDFRDEFRGVMSTVVRQDVYRAEQETLRGEMATMRASYTGELATLRGEMATMRAAHAGEVATLRGRLEAVEADKRQNKGLAWSAIASAAVAIVLWLVKAN